jgi:hypothetical protein
VAKWDYWYPQVLVHVPGAPNPLIAQALRTAARKFFRRTRAWVQWLDPVRTTGRASSEYDFDLPTDSELFALEQATQGGRPYPVQSFRHRTSDPAQFGADQGQGLVSRDLQTFVLTGGMPASERVQVQVVLIPSATATGIPDELASRYLEALAEGAKSELMLTPETPFFNPELAAVANEKFEQAMNEASTQAYRGHTKNVPRARPKWC